MIEKSKNRFLINILSLNEHKPGILFIKLLIGRNYNFMTEDALVYYIP
jgi:hypothetical protein